MPGLALPLSLPLDNYPQRRMHLAHDMHSGARCLVVQLLSQAEETACAALINGVTATAADDPAAALFDQADRLTVAMLALAITARDLGVTDGAMLAQELQGLMDEFARADAAHPEQGAAA